ncbi:glycoside hydrolase family 15 protein [Flammeovirgaceae bacterium SG7u.111]|nr:glycoside hydrolase family 15 protein [Flammeovirgaceae bacterium SG7u.132]WPO35921.1 glycoside hydrolase family 15 protein [Flammeovirgaceae bacterium SG7u.111]
MSITERYKPIENYGLIGDLLTTALVGMDGSIDFMSFPEFDSPTIFASLLDHDNGGFFKIAPRLYEPKQKQMYLPNTNVLISRFLSKEGVAEISDFMPVEAAGEEHHDLVRRAKTVRGEVHYEMICAPRFNYGLSKHTAKLVDGGVLFESQGEDDLKIFLRCSIPVKIVNGDAVVRFTLKAGETEFFILEKYEEGKESPSAHPDYVSESFKDTVNFWRRWIRKSYYRGRWREMINRSALTLKLLTSQKYGSVVAAPTFGLPEEVGGVRNWDYRYTWVRDASFSLYALIRLGYTEEAAAFMSWVEDRCKDLNPDGSLQIMYSIRGEKYLEEKELDHFEGYMGSKPVRIGNGAHDQLQLDIYGELMDSVYLYNKYGQPISYDLWKNLVKLVNWVTENWHLKDEGIWEVRGGRQEFLYSRLMCWVAMDRGIRLAMRRSFPAPLDRWIKARDEIYVDIFENFWSEKKQAFVQYKGSETLDAANLLMPLVKFIGPTDPKWLSTLKAIGDELTDDSLVYRYKIDEAASDGLDGDEGTFSMCSFWYVECLSRAGELEQARLLFEKMLSYANHVGLFAEELGPSGEHLGNFPQAFTHLGLISAAYNLNHNLSKARNPYSSHEEQI